MRRLSFHTSTVFFASLVLLVSFTASATAQDKDAKADEPKKEIATVEAEAKPIHVYENLDGVFESTDTHEVQTDFKTWTDLKIMSVADEGMIVSKGQKLMAFDTDSIDKAVAEAEFATRTAEFALENAKLDMKESTATYELDQAIAAQTWKNAREDYQYYQNVQLPQQLDDIDYNSKSAGYFLEYSKDELDQLEKMYTEDELTEESEEIVLKRARRSVESALRSRDRTMIQIKKQQDIDIPREKIKKEDALKRQELSFQRSLVTLPISRQKAQIALAQAQFAFDNKNEHLREIKADQSNMTLTAPADGVLFYGKCVRGKWVGATGTAVRRLETEKKVAANATVMTIVNPKKMIIRASADEDKLHALRAGLEGRAKINSAGSLTVPVVINSVASISLDDGKFDCVVDLKNLPGDWSVMPGMGCKMSFLVRENQAAVVVPKASVFTDDGGITHYVYVVEDNTATRREVVVGHTTGTDLEILDGLAAGEKIAKAKP